MFTLGIKPQKVFFYSVFVVLFCIIGSLVTLGKTGHFQRREMLFLFIGGLFFVPRIVIFFQRILIFSWAKKHRYRHAMNLRFLLIKVPKGNVGASSEMRSDDHVQNMAQIGNIMNQIYKNFYSMRDTSWRGRNLGSPYGSFEIFLEKEVIKFLVAVPKDYVETVEKLISSYYSGATITSIEQPKLLESGKFMAGGEMVLEHNTVAPIKMYESFEADPMDSILSAYAKVLSGEKLLLQVLLSPVQEKKYEALRKEVESYKTCKKARYVCMWRKFRKNMKGDESKEEDENNKYDFGQQQTQDLDKKVEDELFQVKIRVFATSPQEHRPQRMITDMEKAFQQYTNIGLNSFVYKKAKNIHQFARNVSLRSFFSEGSFQEKLDHRVSPMFLNIKELSSILHFPHARFNKNPRIRRQNYKIVPAPDNIPTEGIKLGTNVYGGVKRDIYVKHKDRFRHFYTIGQTGTGKSSMMLYMAMQDIKQGNGFCLIDPHGDLCEQLLEHVPKERIDDLIYFDFANVDYPMGFNVFEGGNTDEERDIITTDIVELFQSMYGKEIFGPRLEDYFRNCALLLMEQPDGGTLPEVMRVFTDDAFATTKLKNVTNPVVQTWFNKTYAKMGEREKSEIIPFFQAKFTPFTTGTYVRNVIGQPQSAFNFGKIMQEDKILLCNLSKGLTGEINSQLVGRMIAIQIKLNALKRAAIPEDERKAFFLYVDEFQNYVSQSFESILSEARKYRLGLSVAHQYIEQLKQSGLGGNIDMSKPIFGNIGSQLYLKVGPEDAEFLEKNVSPEFGKSDLLGMDKYKGIMTLSVDTQPSRPFSINCPDPYIIPKINDKEKVDVIKQISALKRGTKRELAEKEIFYRVGI